MEACVLVWYARVCLFIFSLAVVATCLFILQCSRACTNLQLALCYIALAHCRSTGSIASTRAYYLDVGGAGTLAALHLAHTAALVTSLTGFPNATVFNISEAVGRNVANNGVFFPFLFVHLAPLADGGLQVAFSCSPLGLGYIPASETGLGAMVASRNWPI